MITRFHHINICSGNVPALEDFYRKLFDLRDANRANAQIRTQGYGGDVAFLTDGYTEVHLATRDLAVAFRTGQAVNPVERGHLAFRTDDLSEIKRRLRELDIPFADFGAWAMKGWEQIFFYDPEGNIVEVHQVNDTAEADQVPA
jgi:glyoxylase I family protein